MGGASGKNGLSQARLELRMLDLSVDEAMQYQRLFSRMVYPRKATSLHLMPCSPGTQGAAGVVGL